MKHSVFAGRPAGGLAAVSFFDGLVFFAPGGRWREFVVDIVRKISNETIVFVQKIKLLQF